jgi:zinc protease
VSSIVSSSFTPPLLSRRHLLVGAGAAALGAPWALAARARLSVPALPLHEWRLANGLQVIAMPDPLAATVSVQVWYRVGGQDDPPGRSGFAHLFEHLMFKGTRHMPPEMFDRLTEDVGGRNNAFTAEDVTAYQSEVPANHLERLLWAEAERMAHLNVDQAGFDSERAVVIEEYRERVLASPYGRLFNALPTAAFDVHPYRLPVIGRIEDLQAATLDDVRAFHRTFYRPDNAALVVAGGFEPAQLETWVERHFAHVPRPAKPVPRVDVVEPPRARSELRHIDAPAVPLPAVALVWRGPAAAHADAAALQVAAALLASGESSRLNEALVRRQRIARSAGFGTDLFADAGMLIAWAVASGSASPARLEHALRAEIARLGETPPIAGELEKVRAGLLTAALAERETPQGRAEAAGWALVLRGDARAADRELAELQAVTAADVQRVLRRHLLRPHRVTLVYTQART